MVHTSCRASSQKVNLPYYHLSITPISPSHPAFSSSPSHPSLHHIQPSVDPYHNWLSISPNSLITPRALSSSPSHQLSITPVLHHIQLSITPSSQYLSIAPSSPSHPALHHTQLSIAPSSPSHPALSIFPSHPGLSSSHTTPSPQ